MSARRWVTAGAVVLVVLPLLVSAISLAVRVGGSYYPWADRALLELRVRDIGSHAELLGPYSRFGWFHPGPLLFYLFAPLYRLTGSNAISMNVAALAVNGACLVGIVLLARRRGGLPLMLVTTLFVEVFLFASGPQFVRDDWNPYVTVLPLLLLVFLAWSMTCGDTWALPIAAGVATFMVQSHVGYAALCAAIVAAGVVGLVLSRPASWRFPVLWTGGLVAVFWTPIVVEQFSGDPGNLDKLYRFFRAAGQGEPPARAWKVITMQLGSWPDWIFGEVPFRQFVDRLDSRAAFPFLLVALLAAMWFAWRRASGAFGLDCIVVVAIVAGTFAITRIVGGLYPYLVRWTWVVGMLVALATVWSLLSALRRIPPWVTPLLAAGAVVLVILNTVDAAGAGNPNREFSALIGPVSRAVRAEVRPGAGVVALRGPVETLPVGTGAGIANELERHGIDVRVPRTLAYVYGKYRVIGDERVRLTVLVSDRERPPRGYHYVGRGVGANVFVK
jgi:hypothetical protein